VKTMKLAERRVLIPADLRMKVFDALYWSRADRRNQGKPDAQVPWEHTGGNVVAAGHIQFGYNLAELEATAAALMEIVGGDYGERATNDAMGAIRVVDEAAVLLRSTAILPRPGLPDPVPLDVWASRVVTWPGYTLDREFLGALADDPDGLGARHVWRYHPPQGYPVQDCAKALLRAMGGG